jgi:hypothetical protein
VELVAVRAVPAAADRHACRSAGRRPRRRLYKIRVIT